MDYVDHNVPMLARMFEKRLRGYRTMGYSTSNYAPPKPVEDNYVIEYDEEVLREID